MDIIEMIRYLNSSDGPNMPLRSISNYLGVSEQILSCYVRGLSHPRPETITKMKKGINELIMEILRTWRIYNPPPPI